MLELAQLLDKNMHDCRRVVFLITSLEYHGRQVQLTQLSLKLKARGWDIRVISLLPAHGLAEQFVAANIPVTSLEMERGWPDPRALWALIRVLRRWQPHLLHSHLVHANLLARMARLFVEIPVLIATSGNIHEGGRWRELAYQWTDPLCTLTTNVSRLATERMVEVGAVPAHKVVHIPNSIDVQRFGPDLAVRCQMRQTLGLGEKFVWLAVGRLEAQKDYPNLLRSLALVCQQIPDILLLICGRGVLQQDLEQMVQALGLTAQVRFLGLRRDIPVLLNAADGYVMASAWEGMPGVLLEASAAGLPIVATDVGGNSEVVLDQQSGWLVPAQDSEALAIAMQHLMVLPEPARRQMGEVARRHVVAHYSLEAGIEQWETLYQNMLTETVA